MILDIALGIVLGWLMVCFLQHAANVYVKRKQAEKEFNALVEYYKNYEAGS